ncbi:hyaluronoglucosaminidase [Bacteroides zoogleoformans]|uniref:O-GlcNAcase n=1 Tax=Bacteroides zoogleoformans TaxID=28119 RepID=A0ABM6T4S6_9BACE|nr:beta-N-acetylglucosaminidase [Bacteroides zoogleoformans]AVM51628.1 O-GlcNAcase [Bacteroides zoogleoformans]TWJ16828.1 hyaluronoglucosaminidase [Bacteroides zoogleoformans]
MKKDFLLLGIFGLLTITTLRAQDFHLQPTPKEYVTQNGFVDIPAQYKLLASDLPHAESGLSLLRRLMPGEASKASFRIYVGVKGDKAVKEFGSRIPQKPEGYFLKIAKERIVIAGADERGVYYGVQTLSQLLAQGRLPLVEITDYPDVPYRGVVEGFYGTPWSHEARMRQLEFYGRNKMNVYLYGPKDDPYHSTPHWRKPYPPREAEQLRMLVDKAHENNVIFYWAIHPGQDIRWNEEDRSQLLQKFESMYQLGVRGFAVFFDDISGEGTKADKQAELLNYIDNHFVKIKKDVAPLIMCPTEYNKSWAKVEGGYLTTLGDKLNESIQIMWTGDKVVATIDKPTMDFINPLLKRKAYIWWNFPVSDYVRDHLLLGPVYGNGTDIKDELAAFVSNPMEHAEASKISLYSVADYTWNMNRYDSDASWRRAVKDLMPLHADYLETFASHNSDLGPNGHNFRRDESVAIQPVLTTLLGSYQEKGSPDDSAYRLVAEECRKIIVAADMLLASGNANRPLIDEIKPWLTQFKLVGEYGKEVLDMMRLQSQKEAFVQSHAHAQALQRLMCETDALYQVGVKCCGKYLLPAFNTLFEVSTVRYNKLFNAQLDTQAVYSPYTLESDVMQLASLPVRQKGKTVNIAPSNEVIDWQTNGSLLLSMDYARSLASLFIDLGNREVADSLFRLEVTADGGHWQPVELQPYGSRTQLKAAVAGLKVLKMRLTNVSGADRKVYFKTFRLVEK